MQEQRLHYVKCKQTTIECGNKNYKTQTMDMKTVMVHMTKNNNYNTKLYNQMLKNQNTTCGGTNNA